MRCIREDQRKTSVQNVPDALALSSKSATIDDNYRCSKGFRSNSLTGSLTPRRRRPPCRPRHSLARFIHSGAQRPWQLTRSPRRRVAGSLLNIAEAFGHDVGQGRIIIRQKVSQSDLAAMAGVARENVSRVLNDWTSRSLVTRLAGHYCLENRSALRRETEK
jgi:CRP-like cAMP-binding protein